MNKNATTQLHIYSAFFVLAGFVLNRGVFLLFLAEKGMSVTEIALYQALFNIATVVLELPTGPIGDFFGKSFRFKWACRCFSSIRLACCCSQAPFLSCFPLLRHSPTPFNRDPNKRFYMKLPGMPVKESASSPSMLGCLPRNQSLREWQLCSDLSLPKYLGAPSTYVSPFSISCSFSFCIPLRGRKRPVLKALKREGLTQPRCSDAKPGVLENPLLRYCFF